MAETEQNSRKIILEKAIKLFAAKGYTGTGVQEICTSSNITKPTLYYFFKSKQGVLQAIAEEIGQELLSKTKSASVYEHDFIKGLTQLLKTYIFFGVKNPDYFKLHFTLINSPDNSEEKTIYSGLINELNKVFEEFFINSANEFGNMRQKESLYAKLFHNNILNVTLMCINGQFEYREQTVYQIIHSFVYGVAN